MENVRAKTALSERQSHKNNLVKKDDKLEILHAAQLRAYILCPSRNLFVIT